MTKILDFVAVGYCILLLCVALFSPFGFPGLLDVKEANEQVIAKQEAAQEMLKASENNLVKIVNEVNEARNFDVYYGDLENIVRVFNSVAGVTVQEMVVVYPMDNFREGAAVEDMTDSSISGVRVTLVVDDIWATLGVIEHMELPIYSVVMENPNKVDITFLTGGVL